MAVAACRREAPRPAAPPAEAAADDSAERASLTNIVHGATIISRTGESFLGVAADAVIDGYPTTFWANPSGEFPQSVVIGLPARARIERVGLRTSDRYPANHVQFEGSLDGAAWQPMATITAAPKETPQWFNVPPSEARFLRATVVDGKAGVVRLQSVLAAGKELEPAHVGAIDGCWSINGASAYFEQRGPRVIGVVLGVGKERIDLDGGVAGRAFRFVWTRGNDYGLALISISPDGKHLTGIPWHEEAIPMFRMDPWFGERCAAATPHPPLREDVPMALLQRAGRYSVFGGYIPRLTVPMQIVVHEFREPTPQANKQRAQRIADALAAALHAPPNVTFVAAGSDSPRQQPVTEAMRLLYSSVDVEIRR